MALPVSKKTLIREISSIRNRLGELEDTLKRIPDHDNPVDGNDPESVQDPEIFLFQLRGELKVCGDKCTILADVLEDQQ
jgi:hypothetical protein